MTIARVRAGGSQRELGRACGEALAEGIARSIAFYEGFPNGAWADAADRVGSYVDAARAGVPELAEEVDGLAEGAGASVEAVWVLNCFEELWPEDACTTIVSGSFLIHSEQWYAGHSDIGVIEARPANATRFLSPTCAGFLPAVGISAGGFAQGIDSLSAPDERIGIPRVLVSRLSLGAQDLDAAIAAASIEGRSGGYAHVLAGRDRSIAVETTATSATVIEPVIAHTNHYLGSPDDGSSGSRARFDRALELVASAPPRTLENCIEIVSDHSSTCLHSDDPHGTATVFGFVCDVATGEALVSDGYPCEGRWSAYHLDMEPARVG
jgi:isopenicillin-N N-acyltransferase like protein